MADKYMLVLAFLVVIFLTGGLGQIEKEFRAMKKEMRSQLHYLGHKVNQLEEENRLLASRLAEHDEILHPRDDEFETVLTAKNDTLAERVQLLEVQVTVIQENISEIDEDVTLLDESVNFLFDQQITQDERLLNLEVENSDVSSNVEELQSTTTHLDFRLTALELSTNASVGGLESRVGTLEETTSNHEARLNAAETDIDDLEGITSDHETRLIAAEENIQGLQESDTEHDTRISALEESANDFSAFHAVLTSYDTIEIGSVVQFNQVLLNKGNGYDSTTGVFTVPPGGNGTYFFNAYFFMPINEYARLDMEVNDEMVCTADGDHTNLADYATASCSAVVDAVEGTEIKVVLDGSVDDTPLVPSEVVFRNGFVGFKI